MRIRYVRDQDGRLQARAKVYSAEEHHIDSSAIDREAVTIAARLASHGYEAYIVGGAVRDLLLGRKPKDFDLVTDAVPNRIRKIFANARIIGRRFKLVHVYAGHKIYEVSTFRSLATGSVGNEFGTMEEDVRRRDFTINALYYNPLTKELIDFLGGFEDLVQSRLKPIIPLDRMFKEDPVRMLRGVKYASMHGFSMSFRLKFAIRRDAPLLATVSSSRLAEEFYKIIASGKSGMVFEALEHFHLLQYFMPELHRTMANDRSFRESFYRSLEDLDRLHRSAEESSMLSNASADEMIQAGRRILSPYLAHVIRAKIHQYVHTPDAPHEPSLLRQELMTCVRQFLAPLNLPRLGIEEAIDIVLKEDDLLPAPMPSRKRRRKPKKKLAPPPGMPVTAGSPASSAAPEGSPASSGPESEQSAKRAAAQGPTQAGSSLDMHRDSLSL